MKNCFFKIHIHCILYLFASVYTVDSKQCSVILDRFFGGCTNREGELKDFRNDELNRVDTLNASQIENELECTDEEFCRRIFRIAHISRQSFAAKTLVQISYMLAKCCGACAKYHRTKITKKQFITNSTMLQSYDIIYPVVGLESSFDGLYGFHFVPILNVPSAFYFTLKKSELQIAREVFMACLNKWTLFVMCIVLSIIAGSVAWIAECRTNTKQFPTNFFLGIYEGFWWSFVSMTTVGYGDRIPKTFLGRMFSVIWILAGITMTSIFTATLTIEIMDYESRDASSQMNGKTVGILKYRLHDAIMVAQHGGIAHEIDFNNTVRGAGELFEMLLNNEIDGVLLSRPTYFFFSRLIHESMKGIKHKNKTYKDVYERMENIPLTQVEKNFMEDRPVVGMLMKTDSDCDYFKPYFIANWFQIQSCYLYSLNYKDKKFVGSDPAAKDNSKSNPAFLAAFVTLCVIVALGSIFEAGKFLLKVSERKNKPSSDYLVEDKTLNRDCGTRGKEPL